MPLLTTGAGAAIVAVISNPTTWDPSHQQNGTFTNGNRTVTHTGGGNNNMCARSVTATVSNQKVHIEHVIGHLTFTQYTGFSNSAATPTGSGGLLNPSVSFFVNSSGAFRCVDSPNDGASVISAISNGDRVTIEFDTQAQTAKFRKNGGALSAAMTVPFAGPYYAVFVFDAVDTDAITSNFGSASWVDSPTAGYTELAA